MASGLTYQNILHDAAIRVSALVGSDKAGITASYDTSPLTAANFKSADWPFNSFRDAILMAVAEFAEAIADTPGHPWRAFLRGQSSVLFNRATLPTVSDTGRDVIGVLGTVFDPSDGVPLLEQPIDVVRQYNLEANLAQWRQHRLYLYNIDGIRIEHTRPLGVRIECCHFSRSIESNAFTNGSPPLPGTLQAGILSRVVSLLTKDGSWESQAGIYRTYSNDALAAIRAGRTQMPEMAT